MLEINAFVDPEKEHDKISKPTSQFDGSVP